MQKCGWAVALKRTTHFYCVFLSFIHVCHFFFHHQAIYMNSIHTTTTTEVSLFLVEKNTMACKHKVNVFWPIDMLKIKIIVKKIAEQHRIAQHSTAQHSRNKQTVGTVYRFFFRLLLLFQIICCFRVIAATATALCRKNSMVEQTQNICIYTYVNS